MARVDLLLKNILIFDPASSHHQSRKDILIQNDQIREIGSVSEKDIETIDAAEYIFYPGMMDMLANFREPGDEHKETIESGIKAAKAGGFTAVALSPDTSLATSSKSYIDYVTTKAKNYRFKLYPYGSISEHLKGENISEMYDMQQNGAIGFTDDKQFVNPGLMSRAILYAKNFNGLVISFPYERSFGEGLINEGKASVMTGLKSTPALAEYLQVSRDLELVKYHEAKIHFSIISCKESVNLIRGAKKNGLKVTCGTTPMHLTYTDEMTQSFDSNYKILPPLRSEEDRKALWEGLKDGTIDIICTDHAPHDKESKIREFDHADFGVTGLETASGMLFSNSEFSDDLLYKTLIKNPRQILGIAVPSITKGKRVNGFIFDKSQNWRYDQPVSKGLNNPLYQKEIKGKVIRTLI